LANPNPRSGQLSLAFGQFMKTTRPSEIIAHEILIIGFLYLFIWAIWRFLVFIPVSVGFWKLFMTIYMIRLCIGSYRFLSNRSFTLSSISFYPSLFLSAFLFLGSSYLFTDWIPYILSITVIPGYSPSQEFRYPSLVSWLVTVGLTYLFATRASRVIMKAEQGAAANP
jgi:hypothetical protein